MQVTRVVVSNPGNLTCSHSLEGIRFVPELAVRFHAGRAP